MLTGEPVEAVLLDVGGPLVDETEDFAYGMTVLRELLSRQTGREVWDWEIESARRRAIDSWAPSFTKAVIWEFLQPDKELTESVYREAIERTFSRRQSVQFTPEAVKTVELLSRNYRLALAGNQSEHMKAKLEHSGITRYFESTLLSCDLGLHKPDSRFFLAVCERLGVRPSRCCMVGDRLDNDIYPANVLGMRTVWFKVGLHAVQSPRVPEDVPDEVITELRELPRVLESWRTEGI